MIVSPWEYYSRIAKEYDSMYETPKWRLYHRLIQSFLSEHLKEPCKVLDLGGGTGRWSLLLQGKGFDVTLVDPSEEMLKIAGEKGVKKLLKARAEDLPFPSCSFDAVLAMGDVLSYVENKIKAFSEIARVLIVNGLLLATVDNFYTFLQNIIEEDAWEKIPRFLKTQTLEVGNTLFSFNSYAFKPEDIESIEGFDTIDVRGIGVFDYSEVQLREKEDMIFEMEKEFSRDRAILWRAEHIFFALKKKEEPFGSPGGCGRD
ncbi:bifunctional 2-polyprenyl-6-hydroxyphenol methylase/3-demethylubiquinol 3-O-methyltransferase UbiG [Thermotoga sp. SG1]|uniref:class I SAM-dependent methyltransferase n=1 Tax=Thermotoga sp. SG1 TaxID=126739 RepID=UPI000C782746|nr:class I SAM-dependent methyltransferase [Thermotoga sp. SG1]